MRNGNINLLSPIPPFVDGGPDFQLSDTDLPAVDAPESPQRPYLTIFGPSIRRLYDLEIAHVTKLLMGSYDRPEELKNILDNIDSELDCVFYQIQRAQYLELRKYLEAVFQCLDIIGQECFDIVTRIIHRCVSYIKFSNFDTSNLLDLYKYISKKSSAKQLADDFDIKCLNNLILSSISNYHDIRDFYKPDSDLRFLQGIIEENLDSILVRVRLSQLDANDFIDKLAEKPVLQEKVRQSIAEDRTVKAIDELGTSPQIHTRATL